MRSLSIPERKRLSVLIGEAIREDVGSGDLTSRYFIPAGIRVAAVMRAKEEGILAGLEVARLVFQAVDKGISFVGLSRDGEFLRRGIDVARISGPCESVFSAERLALNFLCRLSGIATFTHRFVEKIEEKDLSIKIMDTRKTTPAMRFLERYAVRVGGGYNHRQGLFDQMLIKDNHLKVYRLLEGQDYLQKDAITTHIRQLKKKVPGCKIEIEVDNLKEYREVIASGCDIIMLDNMSPRQVREAVGLRAAAGKRKVELEISGGVTLGNIHKFAIKGVDRISVGALTHSAPALDLSLEMERIIRR